MVRENYAILCPKAWSRPVRRTVTGQEPFSRQDSSGKSLNAGITPVLTARNSFSGTSIRG